MIQLIKRKLSRVVRDFFVIVSERLTSQIELRRTLRLLQAHVLASTPGNPAAEGYKIYSQFDEDGIIASIFSRIGSGNRTFVEIGCSDGLENNTHALLLQGWRGVWIDADKDKIKFAKRRTHGNSSVLIRHALISPDNVQSVVSIAMRAASIDALDLFSLDIDGVDLHVLDALLASGLRPRVVCAEYNAKFPPPLKVSVATNTGSWHNDDYQGASLSCFVDMLGAAGYTLVACSLSGVNAFFVHGTDASKFPAFTTAELYQPARYDLRHLRSGHRASLKFIQHVLILDSRARSVPK